MHKYPFVKQRGLNDCGPACVQMILKYYNGYVDLDKLSEMLCTNSKGTTAYHITLALKHLGFESSGYKNKSISSFNCPCIALIDINSYNHYVVIYSINYKKKKLIIGDPSKGIIKTKFDDFFKLYKGIVIEMIPIRNIICDNQVKVFDFIFKLIKPNIKYLFLVIILSLFICIFSFFNSFFMQAVVTFINQGSILYNVLIFFGFLFLIIIVFNYFRNLVLIKMNEKIDSNLYNNTYKHIINLPYYYCKNKTVGEIVSYFNDLLLIKGVINHFCISLFLDLPLIIFLSIFMFFLSYQLFIINMFIICLYFSIYLYYKKKNYYQTDKSLRSKALVNSFITESIKGYETIRNLSLKKTMNEKFQKLYFNYLNINKKMHQIKNNEILFRELVGYLFIFLVIIYGIINMKSGISLGMFITLFLLSSLINSSFKNILDFDYEFEEFRNSINHVGELFLKNDSKKDVDVIGNIDIHNLSYSFNRVNSVLKDINLCIKCGSKVMVTGVSGSGKSTLFKIVKGYLTNYSGSVSIGGYESKNFEFNNVVYVSGKDFLFTGRVIDNLKLRMFSQENNEICELNDFISDYNMLVEEDSFNISDGQKQRINLARCLSNFNILIIDEGLSQVDVDMERRILKKLFRRYQSKTIIYISHRLDNLDLFNRFLRLENGSIVLDEVYNN